MLRAGGSDAFVSDYLGMKPAQVAEIRDGLRAAGARPAARRPRTDDAGGEDKEGGRGAAARRRARLGRAAGGDPALFRAAPSERLS